MTKRLERIRQDHGVRGEKRPADRESRKREIRSAGLRLFARLGYSAVNFGSIAKEAGVSRPLVYTYFKDKRRFFNEAIDEATGGILAAGRELMRCPTLSADAKLHQLCGAVFAVLFDNRDFLGVVVDYLCTLRRRGEDPVERVLKHTVGLKRLLRALVLEAVKRGEYEARLDPARAVALIYSQFEAAVLRLAVSGQAERSVSVGALDALLQSFRDKARVCEAPRGPGACLRVGTLAKDVG